MIDLVVGAVKASDFEAPETYATVETPEGAVYVLVPMNGPSAHRLSTILRDFLSRSLTKTDKGTLRFEALNAIVQSYEADIEAALLQRLKDCASRGLSSESVVEIAYHAALAQCTRRDGHKFLDDILKACTQEITNEVKAEEAEGSGS